MHDQRNALVFLISALALCVNLVGCGGGGGTAGGSTDSTDHSQPTPSVPTPPPIQVLQATGNATQYTIASPAYSMVSGSYTNGMVVKVSFSTPTPLSSNLSNVDASSWVSTLNIDDGLFSGSSGSIAHVPGDQFLVSTDASGNIVSANFKIVSTLAAATVGGLANHFDFDLKNGSLAVSADNGATCTEVDTNAVCKKVSASVSHASVTGGPTLARNEYANYSAIYVFGDSDTDTGRRFALAGYPASPYWKGRHTDGPVGIEYLASDLGIPINKRTSFAVGGATTGVTNIDTNANLVGTGMLAQLETYKQQLNGGQADPDALYLIRGGSNDFTACGNTSCTTAQIDQMIANIDTLVRELYALGAKNIFLSGVRGGPNGVRRPYNDGIKAALDSFKAQNTGNFYYFDDAAFYTQTVATDNPYGFTTHTPNNYCYTGNFAGTTGAVCATRASYAFWDANLHWTTRAMHVWGNALAATLRK